MADDANTHSRSRFDFRVRKPGAEPPKPKTRACDAPGCAASGEFKAPKERDNPKDFHWFCLEHVRAYNEAWDFFRGMRADEIEQFQREAVVGHRPTWTLGKRSAPAYAAGPFRSFRYADAYGMFSDEAEGPEAEARPPLSRPQREALATLGLDAAASLNEIKVRYKELVKRYHPDANGGDTAAEERLKRVNYAYGVLKSSGLFKPAA